MIIADASTEFDTQHRYVNKSKSSKPRLFFKINFSYDLRDINV